MTPHRADSIDVLRGMAMLWMTVFHFCFDLSHFGLWPQDFRADPWWTQQRTAIVAGQPQMPLPASFATFSCVMPPMATTGMDTAPQMALSVS